MGRRRTQVMSKFPVKAKHFKVDFYDTEELSKTLKSIIQDATTIDALINNSFDFSPSYIIIFDK